MMDLQTARRRFWLLLPAYLVRPTLWLTVLVRASLEHRLGFIAGLQLETAHLWRCIFYENPQKRSGLSRVVEYV